MTTTILRTLRAGLFALMFTVGPVHAGHYMAGDMMIMNPWARPLPAVAPNGASYMELHNKGVEADKLVAAATPVAAKTEIHNVIQEDGLMKMKMVPFIEIPAGGMTALKPGGYHVMMIGLNTEMKEGTEFPLTLKFEKAGEIEVVVTVRQPEGDMPAMDHSRMDHSSMDHSKE